MELIASCTYPNQGEKCEKAWYEAAQNEPRKTFKKIFKAMKKEKCLSRGVTIGGDNMDVYMPQFINFFKNNLL